MNIELVNIESLCKPLIVYLSKISYLSYKGEQFELEEVKREINAQFEWIDIMVKNDPSLFVQYSKIKLALAFYVDYVINEGNFSFTEGWENISLKFGELSGDDKFFDIYNSFTSGDFLSDDSKECIYALNQFIFAGFLGKYKNNFGKLKTSLRLSPKSVEKTFRGNKVFVDNIAIQKKIETYPLRRVKRVFMYLLSCVVLIIFFVFFLDYYCTYPLRTLLTSILNSIN